MKKIIQKLCKFKDNTINSVKLELNFGIGANKKMNIMSNIDDILSANINKLSIKDYNNIRAFVSNYIKERI